MDNDTPLPPAGPGAAPTPAPPPSQPGPGGQPSPAGHPGGGTGSDAIDSFFDSIRRTGLVRTEDRWIGGVASGLALRIGIDALLVRAAFGVLMALSGIGFILYAFGWMLLPEQRDGRIHLQETIRGRVDSAIAGAGILLLVGLFWRTGQFGWWAAWGNGWFEGLVWIALTAFVVYVVVTARKKGDIAVGRTDGWTQATPGGPWTQTGPVPPGTWTRTGPGGTWAQAPAPSQTAAPGSGAPSAPAPAREPLDLTKSATAPRPPAPATASASAPAQAWTPPAAPPRPQPPVRPVVRGPGGALVGLVLGLALLTFAGLLLADRADLLDGTDARVLLITLGVTTVLAGLGIVVSGLRGRSSGALGLVAILAIVVGLPLASWNTHGLTGSTTTWIGESVHTPTSAATASEGYSMGAGELTLDLSELDVTVGETLTVPVQMGVGDLTVIVPRAVPASAEVSLGAGQVTWRFDDDTLSRGGVAHRSTELQTDAVRDGATAQIHLDIQVGAGDVLIKEES